MVFYIFYIFLLFFMIWHRFCSKSMLCNLLNIDFGKPMLTLRLLLLLVSTLINNRCWKSLITDVKSLFFSSALIIHGFQILEELNFYILLTKLEILLSIIFEMIIIKINNIIIDSIIWSYNKHYYIISASKLNSY